MGKLNNSITKGQGNIAGFIGEIMVSCYLNIKRDNTYEYDLISNNSQTYDVKTKRCTSIPQPNYAVSVCAFNITHKCDAYIFVRINSELTICWILGYMPKNQYYQQAKFCKKGDPDPDDHRGFKFIENCYNMYIKDLKPIHELLN